MSETIAARQVFSLYGVTRSIEKAIACRYQQSYWIKTEVNKLNLYHDRWFFKHPFFCFIILEQGFNHINYLLLFLLKHNAKVCKPLM